MKSVLITGASTGFGADAAVALAEAGWQVFASMRDLAKADAVLMRAASSEVAERIMPITLDVTDAASVEAGVAQVLAETGGTLDALLNNAGYSILGAFEDIGDAGCRAQMETNFFGALAVTRAVLPAMRQAQRGRIVIITSNAVNTPHPMLSMYAASKWALEGWAEGLAMEVAPFGIGVSVIQPGAHRTAFASNVQFVAPHGSAYARWLEQAAPSIAELDKWSRDPALALGPIVDAVTNEKAPFRIAIGEDTQLFSALKGMCPYELRAFALRAIVGAPAAGAFTDRAGQQGETDWPIAQQVLARIANAAAQDPAAAAVAADTFRLG